jgi:8-oxo-dGTP pyrophosphatase MutT (NUDIX family)
MKSLSCGVVLVNRRGELFACHTTGTRRWDLPKGLADGDETPRAAAVREAWEEAGLRVPPEALVDLGVHAYLPAKRLHLFALRVADDAIELSRCSCRSFFDHHRTRLPTPEADAWAWQPRAGAAAWCGKNMVRVLGQLDWAAIDALPEVARIAVE